MNTHRGESNANEPADLFVPSTFLGDEPTTNTLVESNSEVSAVYELSRRRHRLVTRAIADLRPHPAFVKHGVMQALRRSSEAIEYWNSSNSDVIVISINNVLLKGDETVQCALRNGVEAVNCLEYDYTDDEALSWLLKQLRTAQRLNDYLRISLALELETSLRERARQNQRSGGKLKGSTNLTEDQAIDVRHEIALIAGVCDANVGKVRTLVQAQDQEVLTWLREGTVSIDRAFQWLKNHGARAEYLESEAERAIKRDVSALLKRHSRGHQDKPDLQLIARQLLAIKPEQIRSTRVIEITHPEPIICISKKLLEGLQSQELLLP